MYFISEHSSFYESDCFGTLIGIHENFLYSANSFDDELKIYRRKVMETREWELFWSCEISSRSYCTCSNTVAAAYGLIGNEIYIAAYGLLPNGDAIRFHLSSINLITFNAINYKTEDINTADLPINLCNQCCQSSIAALNPQNPFELSIIPWTPEPFSRFSTPLGTFTDCIQTKLLIDPKTKTCTYLQSAPFNVYVPNTMEPTMNDSNIGVLEFGKILFFRNEELILGGTNPFETKLKITGDSDLKKCRKAAFYNTPNGLQCIAFDEIESFSQPMCSIFDVAVDEEKHLAKFTKVRSFPSPSVSFDPRVFKFVMDSRMLICCHQNQTFTFVFGMLSLSEASYISASNSYSPLFKEYQKLSTKNENKFDDHFGIFKEAESFGLTQNEIKELLGLPKSFEFSIY
uniref:Uncharacterized protein n=1 Tax=Panagrolaimus davidi TaxID=227884 RepID=A0A914PP36_9BILA